MDNFAKPKKSPPEQTEGEIWQKHPWVNAQPAALGTTANYERATANPLAGEKIAPRRYQRRNRVQRHAGGVAERIRTSGLPLRRRPLYPAELQRHLTHILYQKNCQKSRQKS